jgi:hypothetical protein
MQRASQLIFLPRYFTNRGIFTFVILLMICMALYVEKALPFQWIVFGIAEVALFFFFAARFTNRWSTLTPALFQKKLIRTSMIIRVVWVIFSYFYFSIMTGQPFEYEAADAMGYHGEGVWLAGLLVDGKLDIYLAYIGKNYADMGYPFYLGLLYLVLGSGVLIPRFIKAILGTVTCVMIYKLARNNFGEATGRIAGILAMLLPNLVYYCGLHVKETEMVFLVVSFIYIGDRLLRAKNFVPSLAALLVVLGAMMFLYRTVLAVCLIGSVVMAIFFVSRRISNWGKRVALFALVGFSVILLFSTSQKEVIFEYIEASDKNQTSQMENFATVENANKLATYGSRSIFLPFMLMAPFPTLVDTQQPNPMMLGGAFYTRNIYAFFVLMAFFVLYKRKQLRNHILIMAIMFSYLFVLASSGFALSERFHLPIVPFLLIFAAYGISQMDASKKKYFVPYLLLVSCIVIAWNWFKLAGRG